MNLHVLTFSMAKPILAIRPLKTQKTHVNEDHTYIINIFL